MRMGDERGRTNFFLQAQTTNLLGQSSGLLRLHIVSEQLWQHSQESKESVNGGTIAELEGVSNAAVPRGNPTGTTH